MRHGKFKLVLALTIICALLLPGLALADATGPPPVPMILSGTVQTTAGAPVLSGTVNAYIAGTLEGHCNVASGAFGGSSNMLLVSGGSATGDQPIVFKLLVGGVEYPATSTPAEVDWKSGSVSGIDSPSVDLTVDMTAPAPPVAVTVAAPTASPAPGTYSAAVNVLLTSATAGATIFYTTDGTDPASGPNKQAYTGAIAVPATATINAVALLSGAYSDVAAFSYVISTGSGAGTTGSPAASVSVQDAAVVLTIGQTKPVQATANPSDAQLSYVSDHLSVATVDGSGLITAVSAGTAYITVTASKSGYTSGAASVHVTVSAQPAPAPTPTPTPTPAPATPTGFTDLNGHWAQQVITGLVYQGIISGYPDNTFRPDNSITRAEFATMLAKALSLNTAGTTGQFADVATGAWYYGAVNAAASADLVSGMGGSLFAPNALITREQMAVMVAKALGTKAPAVDGTELNTFSDKPAVSSWAVTGMEEAVKAGIVSGMTAALLDPLANATRAQAAAMISHLLGSIK